MDYSGREVRADMSFQVTTQTIRMSTDLEDIMRLAAPTIMKEDTHMSQTVTVQWLSLTVLARACHTVGVLG